MEKDYRIAFQAMITTYDTLSTPLVDKILECGTFQQYQKNEIIFAEKKYNAFEYFQIEGVSHRYNFNEDSEIVTTGIYSGGIVITPHFARMIKGQSLFSLQALTECIYLKVPIGAFDELRKTDNQIWSFGQRVVEREFIRSLTHEVEFRSHSSKDRLISFRTSYPMLENLIPHTVIASFLGITPVSFSRLRHELAKK